MFVVMRGSMEKDLSVFLCSTVEHYIILFNSQYLCSNVSYRATLTVSPSLFPGSFLGAKPKILLIISP